MRGVVGVVVGVGGEEVQQAQLPVVEQMQMQMAVLWGRWRVRVRMSGAVHGRVWSPTCWQVYPIPQPPL